MALPKYVVNLDELIEALKNGFASDSMYNLQQQKVVGLSVEIDTKGVIATQYEFQQPAKIIYFQLGVNDCRNIGYNDTIDVFINKDHVVRDMYIKEMYERKKFKVPYEVNQGDIVIIKVNNDSGRYKQLWFDIVYYGKR